MANEILTVFNQDETNLIHRVFEGVLTGRGFCTEDFLYIVDHSTAVEIYNKSGAPANTLQKKTNRL